MHRTETHTSSTWRVTVTHDPRGGVRHLLLVRHGETDANAQERFLGRSDPPLNERGIAQARRLAPEVEAFAAGAVLTSAARRARQTAQEALGPGVALLDDAFREVDFGTWEGRSREEVAVLDPSGYEAFRGGRITGFPSGDRIQDVAERVGGAVARQEVERLVVISHATTIRVLVARLLGLPVESYRSSLARPANGSWTRLARSDEGWRLLGHGVVPGPAAADDARSRR